MITLSGLHSIISWVQLIIDQNIQSQSDYIKRLTLYHHLGTTNFKIIYNHQLALLINLLSKDSEYNDQ